MRVTTVMINTLNPKELSGFWSELMGLKTESDYGDYLWLEPDSHGLKLGFQKVKDRAGDSNIHIDILVDDKEVALKQIIGLGGKLIEKHGINYIVADSHGNVFDIYEEQND